VDIEIRRLFSVSAQAEDIAFLVRNFALGHYISVGFESVVIGKLLAEHNVGVHGGLVTAFRKRQRVDLISIDLLLRLVQFVDFTALQISKI